MSANPSSIRHFLHAGRAWLFCATTRASASELLRGRDGWSAKGLIGAARYGAKDFLAPHNLLEIKTLGRSYADPSEKLLHASFAILVDFVENEMYRRTDWASMVDTEGFYDHESGESLQEYREECRRVHDEIFDLYCWWKHERPHRYSRSAVMASLAGNQIGSPLTGEKTGSGNFRWDGDRHFQNPLIKPLVEAEGGRRRSVYDAWDEEDNENLKRLAAVRAYLWS